MRATTGLDVLGPPNAVGRSWPLSTAVSAYGVRLGVRATDRALFARLCERLPPGGRPIPAETDDALDFSYSFTRNDPGEGLGATDSTVAPSYVGLTRDTPFIESDDEDLVVDTFESTARFDVAVTTTEFVFVHAGVVGWHGGAIVIPAPSRHGKSTLVAALVRAGATYYSDEFAVVDTSGLVHPFPIPIALRNAAGGTDRVTVGQVGTTPPLPIRVVLSTHYEPDRSWSPRRGTSGEALLALFANTVRARVAPAATLAVLARAVAGATLIEGVRGEADSVPPPLLEGTGSENLHRDRTPGPRYPVRL